MKSAGRVDRDVRPTCRIMQKGRIRDEQHCFDRMPHGSDRADRQPAMPGDTAKVRMIRMKRNECDVRLQNESKLETKSQAVTPKTRTGSDVQTTEGHDETETGEEYETQDEIFSSEDDDEDE